MDKPIEDMDKHIEHGFQNICRRLDEISIGADELFELFCKRRINALLQAEQIQIPYIESSRHFRNSRNDNHHLFPATPYIEIDLFCPDPAIMGAISYHGNVLHKLQKFIHKITFMENHIFHQPARNFFCALEIDSSIYFDVQKLATQHNIHVISKELKA